MHLIDTWLQMPIAHCVIILHMCLAALLEVQHSPLHIYYELLLVSIAKPYMEAAGLWDCLHFSLFIAHA